AQPLTGMARRAIPSPCTTFGGSSKNQVANSKRSRKHPDAEGAGENRRLGGATGRELRDLSSPPGAPAYRDGAKGNPIPVYHLWWKFQKPSSKLQERQEAP